MALLKVLLEPTKTIKDSIDIDSTARGQHETTVGLPQRLRHSAKTLF